MGSSVGGWGLGIATAVGASAISALSGILPVPPVYTTMGLVGGGIITVYDFYSRYKSKFDKLFLNCKLYISTTSNVIMMPKVIKKIRYENKIDYILSLPAGMCLSDFELKKEPIQQALQSSVTFEYNNGIIIMSVIKTKLKTAYPFELVAYNEPLKIALGYGYDGVYALDIEEAVHILIAGQTGAGKSVMLRNIVCQLILSKDIELYLVDFARVELGIFKNSSKVNGFYSSPEQFDQLLTELESEADRRLTLFESKNLVNIKSWNKKYSKLSYKVVIVDEFASLASKEYKDILAKLKLGVAQFRKVGIHFLICTQRPSVDIIDGSIKANLPTRISLKLATDTDSRTVLDESGAEKLKPKGNALIKTDMLREIQGFYLSEEEAYKLIKHTIVKKASKTECKARGYIECE